MGTAKTKQIGFRVSDEVYDWIAQQRSLGVNISERLEAVLVSWKELGKVPESSSQSIPSDVLTDILKRLELLEAKLAQSVPVETKDKVDEAIAHKEAPKKEIKSSLSEKDHKSNSPDVFYEYENIPVDKEQLVDSEAFSRLIGITSETLGKNRTRYSKSTGYGFTKTKNSDGKYEYFFFKLSR
jgi:hypothetical protein